MAGFVADLVVVLHLCWISFLIFGAVPGRRWRWVQRIHLGGLGLAAVLTAGGWICPLTHLEVWLRRQAGSGYTGSFVAHYAERLVYLELPRGAVLAAVAAVAGLSGWAYTRRGRAGRRGRGGPR